MTAHAQHSPAPRRRPPLPLVSLLDSRLQYHDKMPLSAGEVRRADQHRSALPRCYTTPRPATARTASAARLVVSPASPALIPPRRRPADDDWSVPGRSSKYAPHRRPCVHPALPDRLECWSCSLLSTTILRLARTVTVTGPSALPGTTITVVSAKSICTDGKANHQHRHTIHQPAKLAAQPPPDLEGWGSTSPPPLVSNIAANLPRPAVALPACRPGLASTRRTMPASRSRLYPVGSANTPIHGSCEDLSPGCLATGNNFAGQHGLIGRGVVPSAIHRHGIPRRMKTMPATTCATRYLTYRPSR